jgi:excisionase family DNA binding protein
VISGADFESLWTVNDVVKYLKASRSWVYQRAEAGIIPSIRIGGLLRFVPEEVRKWALDQRDATSK